jgi:hypothetical protein
MKARFLLLAMVLGACGKDGAKDADSIPSTPVTAIPGHESLLDDSHKEGPRLLPTELWLRTYTNLIGGATLADAQAIARGGDLGVVFDSFADYLGALGLPDYPDGVARASQTNSLMIATIDRMAIALCIRAAERELGPTAPPVASRRVFAFDPPSTVDETTFTAPFDVLHVTFLGYPVALAETPRVKRYLALYQKAVADLATSPKSRFTPVQAGWAAVCYGLARHPETQAY